MLANYAATTSAVGQAQAAGQPTYSNGPEAGDALQPVSYYDYSGGAGSVMPVLPAQAPVQAPVMPRPTTLTMPSIVDTATTILPDANQGIQPSDLLRPMPSIVTTAPAVLPSPCNSFSQWVSDNPVLAVAGLIGFGFLVLGRKGQ